jgi:hypothetical protein
MEFSKPLIPRIFMLGTPASRAVRGTQLVVRRGLLIAKPPLHEVISIFDNPSATNSVLDVRA